MKFFRTLLNYLCYCGIEKDEYNAVKRDAYISNFKVWKLLHCLMVIVSGFLFVNSIFTDILTVHRTIYLVLFIYSVVVAVAFFFLPEDSVAAQLIIYISIIFLLVLGCILTQNKPEYPAVTFIVMLLITPMFMIDKPYFMGIVISIATAVFLLWMRSVKPYEIWQMDLVNVLVFAVLAFIIHVISNSLRIKEFVLTRKIKIQKDTDDLTGLKNKGALTKAINKYLADASKDKGIFFILDIDYFKMINDTYGHDVGDEVIRQLGDFLNGYFTNDEIVGRFGGDEFIFFIKDTDNVYFARKVASDIVNEAPKHIELPNKGQKVSASIGIALYHGEEKNYSEIFKKADIALYELKATRQNHFKVYGG